MPTKLIFLIVAFAISLSLLPMQATVVSAAEIKVNSQATFEPNAIILSSVSFRTQPSTDSPRIRYLVKGERVAVFERVNSYWYKVTDSSKVVGYVSTGSQYIDTTYVEEENQLEADFPSPPNATAVSSVSFRKGPDTNSTRIRYLKKGEQVLILNKTNQYWYNIQDQNGVIGYVSTSSSYLTTSYIEPYKQLSRAVAAQKVIDAGSRYLGVPYEFASSRNDTSTFDCSDFVRQAFLDGIKQQLPGDSRNQAVLVKSIGTTSSNWQQLKKGDLVFFMAYKGYTPASYASVNKATETVTHVGIYLGDGRMLHTYSQASGGVRIDTIAGSQWELRFLFGGSTY
ncbi:C40 family peptidase [Paenibacillus agricola]|nr:SH3 domain-containing C40 family peptidase [Paenibacillus agricola]